MVTSRTPATKKTATTKKVAASIALPASTAKAAPKTRAKTPAATSSAAKPARPKQAKLILDEAAPSKPRATKKTPAKKNITPEERYQMIAAAAYFLAERHGFTSGRSLNDWIEAEKEIDSKLKS